MSKRILLSCAITWCFAYNAFAQPDLNKLIEAIQNLTLAINHIEIDTKNGTVIAQEYLNFINSNWLNLKNAIDNVAQLPESINLLSKTIENAYPVIEKCALGLCGTAVLGIGTFVVFKLYDYCKKKRQKEDNNDPF